MKRFSIIHTQIVSENRRSALQLAHQQHICPPRLNRAVTGV